MACLTSNLATTIQHEYTLVTIKNNRMLSQKSQLISISISFGWKQGYESSICLSGVTTHKWRENPQSTMQNFPLISHVTTPSFIKYTILFTICFLVPRSQKSLGELGGVIVERRIVFFFLVRRLWRRLPPTCSGPGIPATRWHPSHSNWF